MIKLKKRKRTYLNCDLFLSDKVIIGVDFDDVVLDHLCHFLLLCEPPVDVILPSLTGRGPL
jgi:hypothetical protein